MGKPARLIAGTKREPHNAKRVTPRKGLRVRGTYLTDLSASVGKETHPCRKTFGIEITITKTRAPSCLTRGSQESEATIVAHRPVPEKEERPVVTGVFRAPGRRRLTCTPLPAAPSRVGVAGALRTVTPRIESPAIARTAAAGQAAAVFRASPVSSESLVAEMEGAKGVCLRA